MGAGVGPPVPPLLDDRLGWRDALLFLGLLGISAILAWLQVTGGQEAHTPTKVDIKAGLRSPSIWTLGLSHLGTFGLGNAIAAWYAVYLVHQYGLTLGLAATLGSIALLSGMFFRPPGGILLARKIIGAIPLLRVGTIMGFAGVALLAIPLRFTPLVGQLAMA